MENRLISNEEIVAEAKRLGSIEELLIRAKEVLGTSIINVNYPLNIVHVGTFIEEARERCNQLADPEERKRYQAAIDEVYALWSKRCDEAMGVSSREK